MYVSLEQVFERMGLRIRDPAFYCTDSASEASGANSDEMAGQIDAEAPTGDLDEQQYLSGGGMDFYDNH